MPYPRPMTMIQQIEVTTHCDLRCKYCPSPQLETIRGQPKMDMSLETFSQALDWVEFFAEQGTQGEIILCGIGEPLMHPNLRELIVHLRSRVGGPVAFSTNGLKMTEKMAAFLLDHKIGVWVSGHRPEKAQKAFAIAKRHGILRGASTGALISAMDWAGNVSDVEVTAPSSLCAWLGIGWGNVLVDGRISTCCLDAAAQGVIGNVYEEPRDDVLMQPYSLCDSCHMTIPA